MTLIQRRLNVDATSWRCIDVEPTLYKRHVPAWNSWTKAGQVKDISSLRKTGSDISTTLIQGFNFTNSRFQLHEFTISTSRIHDFNFTNSTSRIHEFNFTNSRIQLHEFTNSISRIPLHESNFMNSRIQLQEFTNSTSRIQLLNSWSWIREFVKWNSWIHEVDVV